jgi:hypothetical protein
MPLTGIFLSEKSPNISARIQLQSQKRSLTTVSLIRTTKEVSITQITSAYTVLTVKR